MHFTLAGLLPSFEQTDQLLLVFCVICVHPLNQSCKLKWVEWFSVAKRTIIIDFVHPIDEVLPALELGFTFVVNHSINPKKLLGRNSIHCGSMRVASISWCEHQAIF